MFSKYGFTDIEMLEICTFFVVMALAGIVLYSFVKFANTFWF